MSKLNFTFLTFIYTLIQQAKVDDLHSFIRIRYTYLKVNGSYCWYNGSGPPTTVRPLGQTKVVLKVQSNASLTNVVWSLSPV